MSLTVLRTGIDTLECSIGGLVRPYLVDVLDEWKLRAQAEETPVLTPMGGFDFALQPQGSTPYRWVLKGDDATLRASNSRRLPGAAIRLSALGLASYDPKVLTDLMLGIVDDYLGPAAEPKLSRLDLASDFQGFDVSGSHGGLFVCKANFRPVYPNIEHPETFQFGKDRVVVRVYNKSKELRQSGKRWLPALWEQHPDYDPTQEVWRFEVQYRRKALVELGAGTPDEAFGLLPELLRYGLGWADLRVPNKSSSEHWPRHPAWETLVEATGTHTLLDRTKRSASLEDISRIAQCVAGYAVSAGAVLDVSDFAKVWGILGREAERHIGYEHEFGCAVDRRKLQRIGKEST